MRVCGVVHRAVIEDVKLSFLVAAVQLFPTHHRIWKLERAVLNALGIETTVGAKVYIFKEKTEERLRNRGSWLIDLHGNISRLRKSDLRVNKRDRDQETESSLFKLHDF